MYKISIIIPVFNVEEYISFAFESIKNQTIGFDNLEVIFVDDASTDGSSVIIDKYAESYNNVISIHLETNSGDAGRPRNVAMEYASADYIMFLDPDDVYVEDACEVLYNEITNEDIDIVGGVYSNGEEVPQFIWLNTLTDPNKKWDERSKKVKSMVKDENFSLKVDSIDEYPSIIANSNIWNKIFKKSFIIANDIKSPEGMPAQDSVFLLESFLNANGIKFINKIIVIYNKNRDDSMGHQISKQKILKRLNAYYKMYYLCSSKHKNEIFKHYLLYDKLLYVTKNHLMHCDLPTRDIIEILNYSMPLFKLYYEYNRNFSGNYAKLFKYIAQKDYENAMKFIYGDKIIHQKDIKVAAILNSFWHESLLHECDYIKLDLNDWFNQLNQNLPNLFIFEYPDEISDADKLNEILKYCNNNQITTIFLSTKSPKNNFVEIFMDFDYIFTPFEEDIHFYRNNGKEDVLCLDMHDSILKHETKLIQDENFFNSVVNQYRFRQILDKINYKYIINLKHAILLYKLNDLNDLVDIYNHFNSIEYPYKHIKLITDKYPFLSDSISEDDLEKIKTNEDCCLIMNNKFH